MIGSRAAITQLLFLPRDPITKVDLILVMGNNYIPTMEKAVLLYKRRAAARILVSGRGRGTLIQGGKTEAEGFRDYAVAKGVPREAVVIETNATNTAENFIFSRHMIELAWGGPRIRRVAVVCLSFHSRRVLMTARRYWPPDIEYAFVPVVDPRGIGPRTWWRSDLRRQRVYAELRRIGEYGLKGDLTDW